MTLVQTEYDYEFQLMMSLSYPALMSKQKARSCLNRDVRMMNGLKGKKHPYKNHSRFHFAWKRADLAGCQSSYHG